MEKRLNDARLNPYSIPVRVAIANQLISSTTWYIVQLWPGTLVELEKIDRDIKCFIWNGQEDSKRPKVAYEILLRAKIRGGFGLILVRTKFTAMAGTSILWAIANTEHTLQHIIRAKIGDMSKVAGGVRDFLWLVSPHATRPKGASKVWSNLATRYNILKKSVHPKQLANWYEKRYPSGQPT